jgi:hypothetical protein
MKKLSFIFGVLLVMLAASCGDKTPEKTYTVRYTVQTVSQYGDTIIINKTVALKDRVGEFSLHQGDLRFITYSTRISGESETLMSGVRYFELIKSDTIKVQ